MPYSKWTETKFFKANQIQEVICTEYPDSSWTIDYYNKKFFMEDIVNSFKKRLAGEKGFGLTLLIETTFVRNNPTDTKIAKGKQTKNLTLTRLDDCQTMQQLTKFSEVDCVKNEYDSAKILFQQAYTPNLILGATKDVFPITRNVSERGETDPKIIKANQMSDVLLEFRCPDIWLVRGSFDNTVITSEELKLMKVDPKDECKLKVPNQKARPDKVNDKKLYTRFSFTLFSMFVSGSFLAGFSVKTFYLAVAYGISGTVRTSFIYGTWRGFVYEITHPDVIIKIIEACYMYRFEQKLYQEEETYRMLQEIIRQPELLKALTGSSLRGAMDPDLDYLPPDVRKKVQHLEKLEAREKFDVTEMKEKLMQ